MDSAEQHLFADNEYRLVQASAGKRFANYIIDIIFFVVVAVVAIIILSPSLADSLSQENREATLTENLVIIFFMILYWFGVEAIFKGKTLGKLITGTRAVNEDGSNLTVKAALLRSLCRAVPFEVFSALGSPSYPWHDKWAKSYVIDEKESNRPTD
jgi:uncharacterized RDD family membrane protein YckC